MNHRYLVAALPVVIGACVHVQASRPTSEATTASITPRDLELRLTAFAHDSMMGREFGTRWNTKATDYVAEQFRRLGLRPAGESGTYFQTLPYMRATPDPASQLNAGGQTLLLGIDYMPASPTSVARVIDGAAVVFAGTLASPDRWIDAEQAKGKVVLFTSQATGQAGRASSPRAIQSDPRFALAAAIMIVQPTPFATDALERARQGTILRSTDSNPPLINVSPRGAEAIFGRDLDGVMPGSTGNTVHGRVDFLRVPLEWPARNVIAVVPGTDPSLAHEYVAITAHNDHIGFNRSPVDHDSLRAFNTVIRPLGADSRPHVPSAEESSRIRSILDSLRRVHPPRLDSIYNGADDDGSGTVALIELAEAFVKGNSKPKRSILFVSHTGEERGLVGSDWFTDHPTVPIGSIVAEFDVDMIGRGAATDIKGGGPTYLEVVGSRRLSREFGDTLEAVNARQQTPFVFNYEYDAPGHPAQYYCRADHYSYARYGIPSVSLSRGSHMDYHQLTDEVQYIDFPDYARLTQLVFDAALAVSNARHAPRLDAPRPANPHVPCRQ